MDSPRLHMIGVWSPKINHNKSELQRDSSRSSGRIFDDLDQRNNSSMMRKRGSGTEGRMRGNSRNSRTPSPGSEGVRDKTN